jgi:hypothetical protein
MNDNTKATLASALESKLRELDQRPVPSVPVESLVWGRPGVALYSAGTGYRLRYHCGTDVSCSLASAFLLVGAAVLEGQRGQAGLPAETPALGRLVSRVHRALQSKPAASRPDRPPGVRRVQLRMSRQGRESLARLCAATGMSPSTTVATLVRKTATA